MAAERLMVISRHLGSSITVSPCSLTEVLRPEYAIGQKFQYTLNSPWLSHAQRLFYEENGYLVIPNIVSEEILDLCSARFVDLCEGRVPKGSITLMKDISLAKKNVKGEFLYNKAQDILYDEVFEEYFLHEQLLNVVESFTGPNMKGIQSMLINKPPDSGALTSRHPLHQDLHYFPFRPADRIVAAWTAMEPVTLDNGCLVVVPGTHKGPLLPHGYPDWQVNKAYHGILGEAPGRVVPLPMAKGETVFFHPLLIHGSGPNNTTGFRKAISCHYAASDCYYIDVEGTTQEDIGKEILAMSQKRGYDLTLQEVWKYRSRLVRGKEITL